MTGPDTAGEDEVEKDILFRPMAQARDATSTIRPLSSIGRAVFLALAIALFGWGQVLGFAAVPDLLSKLLIVVFVLVACWKRGGAATWLTLFFGVLLFVQLRSAAHLTGLQPHTDDLRDLDRTLFFGTLPTQFLQGLFFNPKSIGPLDLFATGMDWSYFLVPYAVVFRIWQVRPRAAHLLVHPLVLTFLLSVAIYGLLPATPPWLASAEPGAPKVYRIMHLVGAQFDAAAYERFYRSVGDPNPTAALPSVHFATTFVLFLYALGRRRIWTIVAGVYTAAMLISLVYLGEHYVTDIILGGLVAAAAWYVYQRILSHSPVTKPSERQFVLNDS